VWLVVVQLLLTVVMRHGQSSSQHGAAGMRLRSQPICASSMQLQAESAKSLSSSYIFPSTWFTEVFYVESLTKATNESNSFITQ
jgi:hypothetical protein